MQGQIIQVNVELWQFLFGLGSTLLFIGIAWGTLISTVKNIKEDIDDIKNDIKDIRGNIQRIDLKLGIHDNDLATLKTSVFGNPGSPMKLTEQGTKLLEDSGFNSYYSKSKNKLFQELDKMGTRTIYDSEKNAEAVLKKLSGSPDFDDIKSYAINNPLIPLDLIFTVASWVIRDDYAKHKELKK